MLCFASITSLWLYSVGCNGSESRAGKPALRVNGLSLQLLISIPDSSFPNYLSLCAERLRSVPLILQETNELDFEPMEEMQQSRQVKFSKADEARPAQKYSMGDENMVHMVIPAHLREVEKLYHVKVLLAVESGSRAWGFESQNSDWDVRFIYVHRPEWYFRIEDQRDVIEHMYNDDVDLVGWELRKALGLLRRCNPSLLEWIHSPLTYEVDAEFYRRVLAVEKDFFNPVKCMYHYNRIYNKHNERYLHFKAFHMKRFLYYLRGVLACQWIERYSSIPPVRFQELVDAIVDDETIRNQIGQLVKIKKSGSESATERIDGELFHYAQSLADHYNETIGQFRPELNHVSAEVLDSILYDMVRMNTSEPTCPMALGEAEQPA